MKTSDQKYASPVDRQDSGATCGHRLVLAIAMLLMSSISYSAVLQFEAGPGSRLMGATNVNVPGFGLYDVSFNEYYCISTGQCFDSALEYLFFPVDNQLDAELFSLALLQDVFGALSTPAEYSLQPYQTNGCYDLNVCHILTPFSISTVDTFCTVFECGNFLFASDFTNNALASDEIAFFRRNLSTYSFDSSSLSDYVFAQWSIAADASPVPAPGTIWLSATGFIALLLVSGRRSGAGRNPFIQGPRGHP